MPDSQPNGQSSANHALLERLDTKMEVMVGALDKLTSSTAREYDKIWNHFETIEKAMGDSVRTISEKVSDIGKPSLVTICAVVALIGSIAVAFIRPLNGDIERQEKTAIALALTQQADKKELADAVRAKDAEIQAIGKAQAVMENDLRWMRGDRKLLHAANQTTP